MQSIAVLFEPQFILALFCHALIAPGLLFGLFYLLDQLNNHATGSAWAISFNNWTCQHIWLPLVRIIAILSFIAMAYPVLYGIEQAPSIHELLNAQRIDTLINTLFIISLILPTLPVIGRLHALTLPIQSLAAAQLLFNWLNQHSYQLNISVIPSLSAFGKIIVLVIASHYLSQWLARRAGRALDEKFHVDGSTDLIFQSILLFFQGPLLLLYTVELGRQVA